MDWRDIVALVGAFIILVAIFVNANIEARKEIKTMEIMNKILKEKDGYYEMIKELERQLNELKNEQKN